MISIEQLAKGFSINGETIAILDIPRWHVEEGSKIAIIGPSGSGKSTLLHMIGALLKADTGTIHVNGVALHELSESHRDQFRAQHIGYILQDFHLIPSLTARQNVELVMKASMSRKEKAAELDQWFEQVGLKDRMQHRPSQLSRGQQQRVAIIRALINRPSILLADEPTGSLDWETAGEITDILLSEAVSKHTTLLTVTHDLNLAERFPVRLHIQDINKAYKSNPNVKHPIQKERAV
ncbi:ABC transporter ATP-binding protein [Paenibacillus sp. FJAT-27812]|uniref:ABC transporter ATP-binding protein n=1 Tax=Paenibacillus sp. FJAT-27812 TaxID=1684143 RepID=UPI0006A795F6|nr:ABC transporter ATP-binding protein [Paenibacillus sp. FJAT-27812]